MKGKLRLLTILILHVLSTDISEGMWIMETSPRRLTTRKLEAYFVPETIKYSLFRQKNIISIC